MNLKTDISEIVRQSRDAIVRARLSAVEKVFLVAAILFSSAVVIFYTYEVAPLSLALGARQRQIQELKKSIDERNIKEKKSQDQAANAGKILESLRDFKGRLIPDGSGTSQIIDEIDNLSNAHKVIASSSNYRKEEADEPKLDENGNPRLQPNRDKKPKIYPNLGVETTVVGDYPNLRRFISDLERSKQFLIVNSLSFQGGDDRITRQLSKGGKQIELSSPESIPVSLKIELDTYFQPPSVGVTTAQVAPAAPKNAR